MTLEEFQQSINTKKVPSHLSSPLVALWYDAQDDWDTAHDYAQQRSDAESAWVHAYLHRKEGDVNNANYWYVRANRTLPHQRLAEEWKFIVQELLKKTSFTNA